MRDFNVMGNDIGDISIYLSHQKLFVFIMNLHMYVSTSYLLVSYFVPRTVPHHIITHFGLHTL